MQSDLAHLLLVTFFAALLTDLATGLGALPMFFIKNLSRSWTGRFTAFAAGMMAAASLVQLVGEGLDRAPGLDAWQVIAGLLAGALFFAVASKWLRANEGFDFGRLRETGGSASLLIVIAMTIHSFPEGVAVGVAYGSGEASLGLSVAAAIAMHNIPEGLAIALALRARGISPWMCVWWAIFSSIPQPLAAVPAAWLVWAFEPLLPFGMAFAAGAMLHLVIADLLPDADRQATPILAARWFIAGVAVMIALGRLVGMG